jgi:hypothetical protein
MCHCHSILGNIHPALPDLMRTRNSGGTERLELLGPHYEPSSWPKQTGKFNSLPSPRPLPLAA